MQITRVTTKRGGVDLAPRRFPRLLLCPVRYQSQSLDSPRNNPFLRVVVLNDDNLGEYSYSESVVTSVINFQ
jgi:hypothetical protein